MKEAFKLRPARAEDWPAIEGLLSGAGLPTAGARQHLAGFVVATRAGELVGCAGREQYGQTGLLRSVAVRPDERGAGLGATLTRRVMDDARAVGLRRIVLLTETAEGYFPKFGFRVIARAEAPAEARASVEFQSACPESATVMQLEL